MDYSQAYAQLLFQGGYITKVEWKAALELQKSTGGLFLDALKKQVSLSEEELYKAVAKQLKIPFWSKSKLFKLKISSSLLSRFSASFMLENEALPVKLDSTGQILHVILTDPLNQTIQEKVRQQVGATKLAFALTTPKFVKEGINHHLNPNAARTSARPDMPQNPNGTVVGKFVIKKKIGEGGMGQVYAGHHLESNKPVAIKLLHSHLSKKKRVVQRFRREAQAQSHLSHPNFVEVFDFGHADGMGFYIVMEKLEGASLEWLLEFKRERITLGLIYRVFEQVCSAMAYAHDFKIYHRDLKPDNLFLIPDPDKGYNRPKVKILDFGVAKIASSSEIEKLTRTGMTIGTPRYMAPEQAGEGKADHRADMYSLGIILFELLSGLPPFQGKNAYKIMLRHVHKPAPRISSVRGDLPIPRVLEEVIDRVLAKKPEDRFSTMRLFWEELKGPLRQLAENVPLGMQFSLLKNRTREMEEPDDEFSTGPSKQAKAPQPYKAESTVVVQSDLLRGHKTQNPPQVPAHQTGPSILGEPTPVTLGTTGTPASAPATSRIPPSSGGIRVSGMDSQAIRSPSLQTSEPPVKTVDSSQSRSQDLTRLLLLLMLTSVLVLYIVYYTNP
jgi:serine/threonine protein kinase